APFIPAHSASKTRVNALMLGIQGPQSVILGPRNGVPATRASRGAPRGDERMLHGFHATGTRRASPAEPMSRTALFPARGLRYEAGSHRPAAELVTFRTSRPD